MEQGKGLSASRWAAGAPSLRSRRLDSSRGSSPSNTSSVTDSPRDPAQPAPCDERQLARFLKLAKRLTWKMPMLEFGYDKATHAAGLPQSVVDENEIHFKLDYYEYYNLLEQALVSLLGVYGVTVDRHASQPQSSARNTQLSKSDYRHRYHANVLSALESPQTPLGAVFGVASVRKQLLRAKELRNRWKYVEEDDGSSSDEPPGSLASYNLDEILQAVQAAIEYGYEVARRDVADYRERMRIESAEPPDEHASSKDWDFMVNHIMDWEPVV
ncbi:hypothetical protein Micbo1qcDRAFT_160395 [Microdochium bolleyi]|uniref:Uncharacterized protein n=1 Tax=Microdochium bolleyi TaxID=196109 RepID=A0A136J622_9PEZI|nr:hypothetical protein Micbo1qcDRAFT_160395 [Microdochium bolleyi]